jgi:hypothetical protein
MGVGDAAAAAMLPLALKVSPVVVGALESSQGTVIRVPVVTRGRLWIRYNEASGGVPQRNILVRTEIKP